MRIVSIGIYNPIPINSGSDAYIFSLLNSIGKNHDIIHYYYSKIKSQNGRYPDQLNFHTEYIEPKLYRKSFQELPKLVQLARPDLIFDRSFISTIDADVVICDDITYPSGKVISKINRVPLILEKQDILWKKFKSDGSIIFSPTMIYENFVLKKVDAITTISMNDYDYVIKHTGSNKNVYYIPPFIDLNVYNPHGPCYNFDNDKLNLLFYGSLDRKMNIDALKFIKYDLIPLLEKENLLEKVRINIFGSGNPPKNLQITQDKNLNYLGVVDNPAQYIRGADLALVPLKNIGGIKIRLLEILSCCKPVLATPEAAIGLPDDLKRMIYVENDAQGYVKIIKNFLNKEHHNKIDIDVLKKYMQGTTMKNVIEHYCNINELK
jgi:glycosyltransferase involved in cell wall biosynthesis